MLKIVASGCSITHGCELVSPWYDPANAELAYPNLIGKFLNLPVENLALPAASNEHVFHSLVEYIRTHNSTGIHSIIAGWTFRDRIYWKVGSRHWWFNSQGATTMAQKLKDHPNITRISNADGTFKTDDQQLLTDLQQAFKFFVNYYFEPTMPFLYPGDDENGKKLHHYTTALTALCESKKIKLVHVDCANNDFLSMPRLREIITIIPALNKHPNKEEHATIAKFIYENCYIQDAVQG